MTASRSKPLVLSILTATLIPFAVSNAQTNRPKQPRAPHKLKPKVSTQHPRNIRELNILQLESRIKGLRMQRLQLLREFTTGSTEIRANERSLTRTEKELAELKKRGLFELVGA